MRREVGSGVKQSFGGTMKSTRVLLHSKPWRERLTLRFLSPTVHGALEGLIELWSGKEGHGCGTLRLRVPWAATGRRAFVQVYKWTLTAEESRKYLATARVSL